MNNTIKKIAFVFISLNIIHAIFIWSYLRLVSANFDYMGFGYTFSADKIVLSSLLILCLTTYISLQNDDFCKLISSLLFVFVSSPNAVIFSFMNENWNVFIWSILCIPMTSIFMSILPVFKISHFSDSTKRSFLIISMVSLFALVFMAHGLNLNWRVFLLQDIYEIRLESRGASSLLSVYSYFLLAKVICPIAVIYAIESRKRFFFVASVVILTYLFMTTGHKSVYFTLLVLIAFSFGKDTYYSKTKLLLIGTIVLFLSSRLLSEIGWITPESLFIRRLFFIPALLNLYFFEYFESVKLFYSGSFFSLFLDYPLDRVPAREIGYVYFNSEDMSANNGYISDGFANMGHVGVIFTIFVTSWIYKLFKGYNVPVKYFGLIFVTFYAFQGSGLSTALVTHGAFLLALLVPLFLRGKR